MQIKHDSYINVKGPKMTLKQILKTKVNNPDTCKELWGYPLPPGSSLLLLPIVWLIVFDTYTVTVHFLHGWFTLHTRKTNEKNNLSKRWKCMFLSCDVITTRGAKKVIKFLISWIYLVNYTPFSSVNYFSYFTDTSQ